MSDIHAFDEYFGELGLTHFGADEIRNNISDENPLPRMELWGHFVPTVLLLDKLRTEIGYPIHLVGCYRAPSFNEGIDGSSRQSQHQAFNAADFKCMHASPAEIEEILRRWQDTKIDSPIWIPDRISVEVGEDAKGQPIHVPFEPLEKSEETAGEHYFVFRGGIKGYDRERKRFVHADTRGFNAFW